MYSLLIHNTKTNRIVSVVTTKVEFKEKNISIYEFCKLEPQILTLVPPCDCSYEMYIAKINAALSINGVAQIEIEFW